MTRRRLNRSMSAALLVLSILLPGCTYYHVHPGALVGPSQPSPLFNRTDFWAQGVTFGLEFRF